MRAKHAFWSKPLSTRIRSADTTASYSRGLDRASPVPQAPRSPSGEAAVATGAFFFGVVCSVAEFVCRRNATTRRDGRSVASKLLRSSRTQSLFLTLRSMRTCGPNRPRSLESRYSFARLQDPPPPDERRWSVFLPLRSLVPNAAQLVSHGRCFGHGL